MKRLFYPLFVLFTSAIFGQLSAGDVAFIGYNSLDPDGFTFIALTDIEATDTIYFTDDGWNNSTSSWVGFESHLKYTPPGSGLSCGTIVYVEETSTNNLTVEGGGSIEMIIRGSESDGANGFVSGWNIRDAGDNLFAYQGDSARDANPSFLAGIYTETYWSDDERDPSTKWHLNSNSSVGSTESHLPSGLVNGQTALALYTSGAGYAASKYDDVVTASPSDFRLSELYYSNGFNWDDQGWQGPLDISPSNFSISIQCPVGGLNEIVESKFSVYPNPTAGMIRVELSAELKEARLKLMTMDGVVLETLDVINGSSVDIVAASGFYILLREEGNRVEREMLIIE